MAPPIGALPRLLVKALILCSVGAAGTASAGCAACGVASDVLAAEGDHVSLLQVAPPWRKRPRKQHAEASQPEVAEVPYEGFGWVDADRRPFDGTEEDLQRIGFCGAVPQPTAFARLHSDVAQNMLLLELTDALSNRGVLQVMVTAMTVAGTYLDDEGGFATTLAQPLEESQSTVFEFRLSADRTTVDVYKPAMGLRTTDAQSQEALSAGAGSGWVGSLDVLDMPPCPSSGAASGPGGPERIVVDGNDLVMSGFLVAQMLVETTLESRLVRARSYPTNLDVTVEYMMSSPAAAMKVGFSVMQLPERTMAPRLSDDRLLYFTTGYKDLGYHKRAGEELPSDAVDDQVSMIWKYDLASLPGRQIRVHVDPTVPERWRQSFREGIEAWNDAFAQAGHPGAVRAVLPGDEDWPADYDLGDARYSTISWTLTDMVVSMGIAKVDPRSGQIIKSDILMSDGWVRAWLSDLDHLAPNVTHWVEQSRSHYHRRGAQRPRSNGSGGDERRGRKAAGESVGLGTGRNVASLLSASVGRPLSREQQEDLLAAGLRSIVMHETGHILGLRHNFKGSLGVSYECTRNKACSAEHGLSASVMDYLPMNMPSENEDVHVFSPVVGAYDKLAIRYGYTDVPSRGASERGVHPDLLEILEAAEAFEVCYDDDTQAEDPTCIPYDMTADPLRYYEDQLERIAGAHRYLLNMSTVPGASYEDYGKAVKTMLVMTESAGYDLVNWLGGIVNAFGLFPPLESLPFLVTNEGLGSGHVASLHVEQTVRETAKFLLTEALAEYRVLQVWEQERLALAERSLSNGTEAEHFGVRELLAGLVGAILPDGLGAAQPLLAWDAQLALVKRLKALYADAALPEEVSSQVLYHLGQVREVALTEFRRADQAGASAGWRACAKEGEECNCSGLVRYGNPLAWSTPMAVAQATHCGNKAFGGDPAPKKRKYCECLATQPQEGDLRRSHLLLLLRELSGVFCDQGGGKPWPWAPGNQPRSADCIGELRAATSEAGA